MPFLVRVCVAALALFVVGLVGCDSSQDAAPADVAPPPAEPAPAESAEAPPGTESVDSTLSALQRAARAAREAELAKPIVEEQKLEPLQRARSGPARIALTDLAEHIGSAVELQLKDGRARDGILESVRGGVVQIQQTVGSGTVSFSVPMKSIKSATVQE